MVEYSHNLYTIFYHMHACTIFWLLYFFHSIGFRSFWFLLVYTTVSNVSPLLYFKGCQSSPFALGQLIEIQCITYWLLGYLEDLINHLQHYKLWGGAVLSLQSMLCCINREWLAAPAKNYIVLSVESDSANFFENFKDTLYLIIFFPFVLLQISLLLKFWIPGTLYSLPKKENILILRERNCSIVFCFLPTMIRIYFLV